MNQIRREWSQDAFQSKHQKARNKIKVYMEELNVRYQQETGYGFIRFMEERIKTPESIQGKLERKELPMDFAVAEKKLLDISGVRVICYCLAEVYWIVDQVRAEGTYNIRKEKDYIRKPKWNGYESYHIVLDVPVTVEDAEEIVPVELQIRTIVMDAWASMDSRVSYKKKITLPITLEKKIKKYAKLAFRLDELIQQSMSEVDHIRKFRDRMTKAELEEQQLLAERFLEQRRKELKDAEMADKKKKKKAN